MAVTPLPTAVCWFLWPWRDKQTRPERLRGFCNEHMLSRLLLPLHFLNRD